MRKGGSQSYLKLGTRHEGHDGSSCSMAAAIMAKFKIADCRMGMSRLDWTWLGVGAQTLKLEFRQTSDMRAADLASSFHARWEGDWWCFSLSRG